MGTSRGAAGAASGTAGGRRPISELPTIDVGEIVRGAPSAEVVRRLLEICHDPGFCYVRGHGVAPALDAGVMRAARRFFGLPEEERRAIAIVNSPHFRGYTVLGDERTGGMADWREQIDFGPEEPPPAVGPHDPPWQRLRGPNQWPAGLPDMRGDVVGWMAAMSALATTMMRTIALGLGQPADHFDPFIEPHPYTRLKIIRYPALPADAPAGRGLGLHHDSGLLTFILQDGAGGLQVQTGDTMVDARPAAGTYVMNLGEMLQAASGGYLRATPHRVQSPPPGVERLSIAFFFNPRLDAVFAPVRLPPELAAKATGGQNVDPDDPVHATFGENTLKIRMRAHPDVVARHYPGVAIRGA